MGAGNGDRYVVGGVNWESYTLEALIAMVSDNASPVQLEQLADDWRQAGNEVSDAATVLETALAQLMTFWSGYAAEQARADVAANARWLGDLGETAHQIGDPIQEAAGALKAVQDAMPDLPPEALVPPARAADGADAGLNNGGALGAAISGTATGAESAFNAEAEQARLKEVAVEAMRRFEGAAIGIDEATPAFTEPTDTSPPMPREPHVPAPQPAPHTPRPTDEERWNDLTGGGTTASGTVDDPPVRSTPGGGAPTPFGGGTTGLNESPHGGPARQPVGAGPTVGLTETFNPGNRPAAAPTGGAIAASAGGAGAGMGGMPMGAGMGAGAGGDANEHRRRYPYDAENPFANDQKASPPVIGL
ncbi:PPE domain-containing protein [Actinokineospora fastidiosa]|uniref:PPE domain-containing protein n=1 Tax=Actinokineospora fastidiosa TaxID=1816 RepID=A0A918G253_9PSEU|nr:PPE domain-containing protein [Actinokineospora fastidiosa]GGS13076.1 hypothetical protein GCM10010171_01010 [Actinokineospora fastidiosa]